MAVSFDNQVILVTGGTRGLGRAFSELAAAAGATAADLRSAVFQHHVPASLPLAVHSAIQSGCGEGGSVDRAPGGRQTCPTSTEGREP